MSEQATEQRITYIVTNVYSSEMRPEFEGEGAEAAALAEQQRQYEAAVEANVSAHVTVTKVWNLEWLDAAHTYAATDGERRVGQPMTYVAREMKGRFYDAVAALKRESADVVMDVAAELDACETAYVKEALGRVRKMIADLQAFEKAIVDERANVEYPHMSDYEMQCACVRLSQLKYDAERCLVHVQS